jgi:hypothetical protein
MALQFLGKDPESEYNGSPTLWDERREMGCRGGCRSGWQNAGRNRGLGQAGLTAWTLHGVERRVGEGQALGVALAQACVAAYAGLHVGVQGSGWRSVHSLRVTAFQPHPWSLTASRSGSLISLLRNV